MRRSRSTWAETLTDNTQSPRPLDDLIGELQDRVAVMAPQALPEAASDKAIQQLLTMAVQLYASKLEEEVVLFPFTGEDVLTPTEVGMTVGHMIKAADIDLFELVSWQSLRGN